MPSRSADRPDELLGIGPQGQVRVGPLRVLDGVPVPDDPGVEGQDAFGRHEQGVDVELGDLREVRGQVGQAHQRLDEPVDGGPGPSPVALEEGLHPELVEHAAGQPLVERGKADGPVPVDLRGGAAHAGHDHGAEGRVLLDAQDHLDAVLEPGPSSAR